MHKLRFTLAMLMALLATGRSHAEEAAAPSNDGWRGELTSWIWLMGMEGEVGARGEVNTVDATFFDVLDASDTVLGFAGRLEIGHGKWAGFVDGVYTLIKIDDITGPLGIADVDLSTDMGVIDFGLMYRLIEIQAPQAQQRPVTLDAFVGARAVILAFEIDPASLPSFDRDESWIDPIFGVKATVPLIGPINLMASGDIGGFGVSSDMTWSALGVLGVDFTLFDLPSTFYAGYRAVAMDYTEGSGSSRLTWDVVLHGPIFGLSMRF